MLPPGTLDLAVGEAHVVRRALLESHDRDLFNACGVIDNCDYQQPHGFAPLVEELERRHNKRVVVTNGAKQGLSACFFAMKCMGMNTLNMRSPFWSQMPAAINLAGLIGFTTYSDQPMIAGAGQLLVSPNNPDGFSVPPDKVTKLRDECTERKLPFVHDAAYYTPVYVPGDTEVSLPDLASTSIHSVAKSYGLSGLRVGWLATDDDVIYRHVCEYIEATTVGVSLPAQLLVYHLLVNEAQYPLVRADFINRARAALLAAKELVSTINPEVLDTTGCVGSVGMFGWFKMGPKFDADKAQIHVAPGIAFGDKTRVRLNLAVDYHVLQQAVERLNAL